MQLTPQPPNGPRKLSEEITAALLYGDLSRLSPQQKYEYYRALCERVGLDPATQPFTLMKLNGKETLYCGRGGVAQLTKKHGVSHKIVGREMANDIWIVTAQASTVDGRCTESIGAVPVLGLKGEALANAMMKAETKSKRRSTLDLLGLGMLDESEVASIPDASWSATVPPAIEKPAPALPPATEPLAGNQPFTQEEEPLVLFYLRSLGWLKDGQTFDNLTQGQQARIRKGWTAFMEEARIKWSEGGQA